MAKVLIVDDNSNLLEIFRLVLCNDFEISEARNGLQAIKVYKQQTPDLVLMDILMPEMDGIDATKEIMKINPKAKIVAITAYSSRSDEIIQAGAIEVLKKPIRKKDLIDKVKGFIEIA